MFLAGRCRVHLLVVHSTRWQWLDGNQKAVASWSTLESLQESSTLPTNGMTATILPCAAHTAGSVTEQHGSAPFVARAIPLGGLDHA